MPNGSANDTNQESAVGFYFDTVVIISAYGVEHSVLEEALEKCGMYERLLSKTIRGSDIWNINHANGQPVEVSEHTVEIIQCAQDISVRSNGAFDVTIAPASGLWDFTSGKKQLPDAEALEEAVAHVDYKRLQLHGAVVNLPEGSEVDFGGIAKGYIADEIATFLVEKGVQSGLINFGGNIVVIGAKPDGGNWKIGIQNPKESIGLYLGHVAVADISVVTSGIYERGFEFDGATYHHLLDPQTGYPVQNELASVSVLSEVSMRADALSTACFVMGTEKAMEFLKQFPEVEAIFVDRDGEITYTKGIENRFFAIE